MPITLSFDPSSPSECAFIAEFIRYDAPYKDVVTTPKPPVPAGAPAVTVSPAPAAPIPVAEESKKKPGRPKKDAAPVDKPYVLAQPGVAAPVPSPAAPAGDIADIDFGDGPTEATKVVDKDVMVSAVRHYYQKKGKDATAELLKRFGATSVGAVKPEDYGLVVKAAQL